MANLSYSNTTPSCSQFPEYHNMMITLADSAHLIINLCGIQKIVDMLDKLWDDVLAGPQPESGLERLRKFTPPTIKVEGEGESSSFRRSMSIPGTPATPTTPTSPATPLSARKENVWRSVFHPGSNLATKSIGAQKFDKPLPNSPSVYDWLYSGETKNKYR